MPQRAGTARPPRGSHRSFSTTLTRPTGTHLGIDGSAYLAAINSVETSFGTNLAVSSAGAVGWMQFEPATWAQYAESVTYPTATADPADPQDAIYTAAHPC